MLEIHPVDPFDDAAVGAWHAALVRASEHGREAVAATFRLEESRALLQQESRTASRVAHVGSLDGRVVTTSLVEMSLVDNLDLVNLGIHTVPEARRHGHGTALLRWLEGRLGEQGRTRFASELWWPIDAPAGGAGTPGAEFARVHGYELGLVEVQRELAMPLPMELLDRLAAEAAPHHSDYTFRQWIGPVPDDLVADWVALDASLVTEAPLGELEREPMRADVESQRNDEARIAKQGRTEYSTVALDASGALVAYTDLATTIHEPGRAYQWGTLVRSSDRGHRLGAAIKVANLRLLRTEHPEVSVVRTWNALDNPHMVAVNDALGFRPVEMAGAFEKADPSLVRR